MDILNDFLRDYFKILDTEIKEGKERIDAIKAFNKKLGDDLTILEAENITRGIE